MPQGTSSTQQAGSSSRARADSADDSAGLAAWAARLRQSTERLVSGDALEWAAPHWTTSQRESKPHRRRKGPPKDRPPETSRTKRRRDDQAVLASSLRSRGGAPATMASMCFRESWRKTPPPPTAPASAGPKTSKVEGDAQRQSKEASSPLLRRALRRVSSGSLSSFGLTSWQEPTEVAETLPLKKELLRSNSVGASTEWEEVTVASSHRMLPSVPTPVRNLVGYSTNSAPEKESTRGLSKVPLVAQLDEFFRRGSSAIPRIGVASAATVGAQPPCRSASFQQRLTAWSREVGLPPELAPILLAEGRAHQGLAPAPDVEQSVEVTVAWQVRILWRGVAVEILLESGVDAFAYPAAAGEAAAAEAALNAVLAGARTDCRWQEARLSVAAAAERALGRPLEAFLDAMHDMWCELSPGGEILTPRPGACTVASPSETLLSRSTSQGDRDEDESLGPSFGEFLAERPPLWRFDNFSRGLAWDFPPSKAEKRELLLLQLLAEARECDTELETVRRESLLPPSRS